jgi:hypothetical protein
MGKKGKSGSKRGAGLAKWQKKQPKKARPAETAEPPQQILVQPVPTNYHGRSGTERIVFSACAATSCLSQSTTQPLWSPEARREGKEANFAPAAPVDGLTAPITQCGGAQEPPDELPRR